ncbi:hypothetical protein DFS34DRAFT_616178 [Phlyctochytrium arcticum]|nr:hypothetical protein DFS34DRAFT_684847 [Phlyctochytrium arcticum]KAI9099816.1 hypothetical protein DFS34DRAFT_616178 [Phlyctochytrium arcticum]
MLQDMSTTTPAYITGIVGGWRLVCGRVYGGGVSAADRAVARIHSTRGYHAAGYETLHAFRNLNLTDLTDAEVYTKKPLKPGHKKLIMQYVANRPYDDESDDMTRQLIYPLDATPLGKRRRLSEDYFSQVSVRFAWAFFIFSSCLGARSFFLLSTLFTTLSIGSLLLVSTCSVLESTDSSA